MAQKTKVNKPAQSLGIFSRSAGNPPAKAKAPADNSDLNSGKIAPVGTGLTQGEREALKSLAAEHELTLNALMRFALRRFIVQVRAGEIDLEAEQAEPAPVKKRLRLPS